MLLLSVHNPPSFVNSMAYAVYFNKSCCPYMMFFCFAFFVFFSFLFLFFLVFVVAAVVAVVVVNYILSLTAHM